jgi:hypothetical protein
MGSIRGIEEAQRPRPKVKCSIEQDRTSIDARASQGIHCSGNFFRRSS